MDLFKSLISKTIGKMNPESEVKTNECILSNARQESVKVWEMLISNGYIPEITEDGRVEYIKLDDISLPSPFITIHDYNQPIKGYYARLIENCVSLKDKKFDNADYCYGRLYFREQDMVNEDMSTNEHLPSELSSINTTSIVPKGYYFESWDGGLKYFREFIYSLELKSCKHLYIHLTGKYTDKIESFTMDYLDLTGIKFMIEDKSNLFTNCNFGVLVLPYAPSLESVNGAIKSIFNSCNISSLYADTIICTGSCELGNIFTNTNIRFLLVSNVISRDNLKCYKLLDSSSKIHRFLIGVNVNELELIETFKDIELENIHITGKVNKLSCKDAFVNLKVNSSNLSAFKECSIPKRSLEGFKSDTAMYDHLLSQEEYNNREHDKYSSYDV